MALLGATSSRKYRQAGFRMWTSMRMRTMAQAQGLGKKYIKAFFKGFFVAVPVTVTFLDRVACVARVEGASMQPSLNPGGRQASDVVLLNHWSIRNYDVQRGDIVSLVLLSLAVSGDKWAFPEHKGTS
ncbi:mitochondrial inner membrane protease subunit 2 isoform X3 [Corvus cornix cornix]|uniref:mitochondrial inner membrane protease subunit 2 isoform X3 n=1 Tax=Corvus cornix cornix TaxID=932674 RepID=UPI001951554F|nr:mitochondrial inner membrane protease subunit 2 isoform X3 [Corvus cornix cornix]